MGPKMRVSTLPRNACYGPGNQPLRLEVACEGCFQAGSCRKPRFRFVPILLIKSDAQPNGEPC